MEEKIKLYQGRFNDILADIRLADGAIEAQKVAIVAAELVQDLVYFTDEMRTAKLKLASVSRDIVCSEVDGKPISVAKAQILIDASDEATRYEEAKMHAANFDQMISVLKIYIRSLAKEYSLQGNM